MELCNISIYIEYVVRYQTVLFEVIIVRESYTRSYAMAIQSN